MRCQKRDAMPEKHVKKLLADLHEHGYDLVPKEDKKAKSNKGENEDDGSVDKSACDTKPSTGYEHLFGTKMWVRLKYLRGLLVLLLIFSF